jgi:guanosine-3',5'-bis(diphosphate) 3'-pyrophosphohydrolase
MNIIEKAHKFAELAHGDQERKFTGIPYIRHPEETAQLLWEATDGKASPEEYAAALLHDVVEDTDIVIEEVGQNFGKDIMHLVGELTTNEEEKQLETKKKYLVKKINGMSNKAFNIKLCDRFSNVVGLENKKIPKNFVKWYVKETEYILNHLERELNDIQKGLVLKINSMLAFLRLRRL